jgi:DnaD/phage-associated family protein
MAWIESHQELARHPKTKKFARMLEISLPSAVGHLHFFWWWAMDYAQDGSLARYDAADIADACGWEGEASTLQNALIESGFIDDENDDLIIHDWHEYAGRLIEKREQNKERKKKSRGRHADVTRTSQENERDSRESHRATKPNPTQPYQTEPNQTISNTPAGTNAFQIFEKEGFGTLSSILADDIGELIDTYSERWVIEAMYEAVRSGKRNLKYVGGILRRWKSEGIDSPWERRKDDERSGKADSRRDNEYDSLTL